MYNAVEIHGLNNYCLVSKAMQSSHFGVWRNTHLYVLDSKATVLHNTQKIAVIKDMIKMWSKTGKITSSEIYPWND